MSYGPNPGTCEDMIAVPRGAVDRRRHVPEHRRGVRPLCKRGSSSARPWSLRATRRRLRPSSGGHRRREDGRPWTADPSRSVALLSRCIGCGSTRSTCSTSTGSTRGADRGRRRNGRRARGRGQGASLRAVRGGGRTIRRAHAVHPVTAAQLEYSPWTCDPEPEALQPRAELGRLRPVEPAGKGFLTGTVTMQHAVRAG